MRGSQQPVPNVALDSAIIRAVSGNEQMVTPSGSCPVGSQAVAALGASENEEGFFARRAAELETGSTRSRDA